MNKLPHASSAASSGFSVPDAETVFARRLELVSESVDLYHIYLRDYLYRLTSQWQDAENLLQDLWQHVLLHFPEEKIKTLPILRRKAWQIFVDFYRARKRRGEIVTDEVPEPAIMNVPQEAYTQDEERALESTFWNGFPDIDLSDQQKQAIWLHARYGFTYKEIEQKLGVPSSTVCDWVGIARSRLSDYLNTQK